LSSFTLDNRRRCVFVDGKIDAINFHTRARHLWNLIRVAAINGYVTAETKCRNDNSKTLMRQRRLNVRATVVFEIHAVI
jgi:hypothetical protein